MSPVTRILKRVTVREARALMLKDNLRIYDLRDEESFARGHIDGAICLSWRDLERVVLGSPKDAPILIYCYLGNVSQMGAQTFHDFGFLEVYDLMGGYQRWNNHLSGAPKTNPSSQPLEAVHGHSTNT